MSLEVFYSYAHEDEPLRGELEKALALLRHQKLITGWHDREISAGSEWQNQIDTRMRSARIILLLISHDFLASSYCYDVEMKLALERHTKGEATVIPIILRPVDWSDAPFAHLQALPRDAKPITTWSNRDEAFADVARGIRRVVEPMAGRARKPVGVGAETLDSIQVEYSSEFCSWAPVLRRLVRSALDVIDARIYVLRPPSSADDAERKIDDLNGTLRSYNEAVTALRHQWRQHSTALTRLGTAGAGALEEAISQARELERWELLPGEHTSTRGPFDQEFVEMHLALAERYNDFAQGLTGQRDRLVQKLTLAEREARRLLEGPRWQPRTPCSRAEGSAQFRRRLLDYFDSVSRVVHLLEEFSLRLDADARVLRQRIESELTPAVESLNEKVVWLFDSGAVFAFELWGLGLSGATARRSLEFVEQLMTFQHERIRQPLHRALVPIFRIDEDRSAPIAVPLTKIRAALAEDKPAFDVELKDFRRAAEAIIDAVTAELGDAETESTGLVSGP